jgi:hypothetical protein
MAVSWRYFAAAALLALLLLLWRGAPGVPVLLGIGIAAAGNLYWRRKRAQS